MEAQHKFMKDEPTSELFQLADPNFVLEVGGGSTEKETGIPAELEAELNDSPEAAKGNVVLGDDGKLVIEDTPKVEVSEEKKETVVEEKEKDTKKEEIESGGNDELKGNDTPLSPLASSLQESNILPDLNIEEFNKLETAEDKAEFVLNSINDRIESDTEEAIKEKTKEYSEEKLAFIDKLKAGVPYAEAVKTTANTMALNNMTEDVIKANEKLQEQIVFNVYKRTTQLSDTKINELVEEKKALNKLEAEAIEGKGTLVELDSQYEQQLIEKKKQDDIAREEQATKLTEEVKETVYALDDSITGDKYTQKDKDEIFSLMTTIVEEKGGYKLNKVLSERAKDPKSFDIRMAELYKAGFFEKEVKLDTIKKNEQKKATSKLADLIANEDKKRANSGAGGNATEDTELDSGGILDMFNSMPK